MRLWSVVRQPGQHARAFHSGSCGEAVPVQIGLDSTVAISVLPV